MKNGIFALVALAALAFTSPALAFGHGVGGGHFGGWHGGGFHDGWHGGGWRDGWNGYRGYGWRGGWGVPLVGGYAYAYCDNPAWAYAHPYDCGY